MKKWIKDRFHFSLFNSFIIGLFFTILQSPGATLTVTNLADSGPGTLRDRIATANSGDMINFSVVGTVALQSELTISKNLRIDGLGPNFTKVSGNNSNRVFRITSGVAQIYYMRISDGRVVGTNGLAGANGENVMGGGVLVASGASLNMQVVLLTNNVVIGGQGGTTNQFGSAGNGGNGLGGGIANLGTLTLSACNVMGNAAIGGMGSPDGTSPGTGGQGWGGGIYSEGSARISIVTIYSNTATAGAGLGGPGGGAGGGIYNAATLDLLTSTIASNTAAGSTFDSGGGIADFGVLTVGECTIAGNSADFGGGFSGVGTFGNTILALNSAGSGPDGSGTINSSDYNLIQDTNGLSFTGTTTHNIAGQNPLLTPLQDNGGGGFGIVTLTIGLLPASPAIDKAKVAFNNADQRGYYRPYDFVSVANAAGGNGSDIGAFEVWPSPELAIQRADTNVVVSWFTNGIRFVLQTDRALQRP